MRNFGRSILRWAFILILYGVFGAVIFFAMKMILENNLPSSPRGYSDVSWMNNIYGMYFNTLGMSAGLQLLWNLLFMRPLLGRLGLNRSVNVMNLVFIIVHLLSSLLSFWYLVSSEVSWEWFVLLLQDSAKYAVALLLPILFVVPFILASRWMAPEVVSHRFAAFKRSRFRMGLRYY